MSENSPKDENKQENNPKTSGPTDPPPDKKTRMDNDSAGEQNPAESTPPGDIDGLLAAAADSLADVDEQLGQEDGAENQTPVQEKDADFTSPDNRVSKVDNTLDNLEQELNILLDEVSEDDKPQQVSEDDKPQQVNEDDKPQQAGEDDSQNNIDDVLSELAEELELDEPETLEDEKVSATDTPVTVEKEPTPETNNIDATPAQPEQEITETPAAEQEKPQSVQSEESGGDTEIEQQSNQAETQISPDEDTEDAQNIIDKLPDIGGADEDDEPTAETIPEADQPAEVDQAVSEVDQVVMKELAEAEDKADEPAPSTTEAEVGQNSRLNFPQRALVQSLETVNKPFESVPDKTKDILGMIGVVTMIVSVIAAALILLMVD